MQTTTAFELESDPPNAPLFLHVKSQGHSNNSLIFKHW